MLTLYRRHKETCPRKADPRSEHNKCKCAIWADGILGGKDVRRSMKTRDWTKACKTAREWEAEERIEDAPVTLDYAWKSLLADLETRELSGSTVRKYKLLKRQMEAYGTEHGLTRMADFDLDTLDRFRRSWKDGPRTALKKLERLRAFFRYALDRDWIEKNPATRLSNPRVEMRPTMPLSDDEMKSILTACDNLAITATWPSQRLNAYRLKALVLLMRYSGMRVSDAVALTTDKLRDRKLFLYTQKTGQPVYTILPDSVVSILEATPRVTDTRYFWTGAGNVESIVRSWQARLKKIFDTAKVEKGPTNAISHRFRDTFAVKLLERGTSLETVGILLGHKSVRITEIHYNPWVKSRQQLLEAEMRESWKHDPTLSPKIIGTNPVQIQKGPVN
jgi:site-specific recombinase XerD